MTLYIPFTHHMLFILWMCLCVLLRVRWAWPGGADARAHRDGDQPARRQHTEARRTRAAPEQARAGAVSDLSTVRHVTHGVPCRHLHVDDGRTLGISRVMHHTHAHISRTHTCHAHTYITHAHFTHTHVMHTRTHMSHTYVTYTRVAHTHAHICHVHTCGAHARTHAIHTHVTHRVPCRRVHVDDGRTRSGC